jgi:acetyltransferase-like isoleucine patch superfamily enzyme
MFFIKKIRFFFLTKIKWRRYSFGKNVYIGRFVYLWAKHNISVGDNFYIGKFSQIECDAEIGNNVIIGNQVGIVGKYDHHYQQIGTPIRLASQIRDHDYSWKGIDERIVIEDDVWIGFGSVILSGVRIGQGSVIAAGSVVTKDVQPFSIYAGVPAKKIRDRFDNESDLAEHLKQYQTLNAK